MVVAAYGLLIPDALLEQALWLNVHPSLLPRWRGAAPVERAIMAGDRETGVTIHRTVKELDAGPIAAQAAFVVEDDAMRARCSRARPSSPPSCSRACSPRTSRASSRSPTRASRTRRRSARPTGSSTSSDPEQAVRVVRALSPHIGARATLDGRDVIVWRARVEDGLRAARGAAGGQAAHDVRRVPPRTAVRGWT